MVQRRLLDFISQTGRALHAYGASAQHIEAALRGIALRFTKGGEFFITPTFHMSSVHIDGDWQTRVRRVQPGGIHLAKLGAVDQVGDKVLAGEFDLEQGIAALDRIELQQASRLEPVAMALAYVLVSSSFCALLGGGWLDCLATSMTSLVAWLVSFFIERLETQPLPFDFISALLVAFCAISLRSWLPNLQPELIILSSLIVLVPGLSVTVALFEISTKNLIAGTARLTGAFAELMRITFGVVFGSLMAKSLFSVGWTQSGLIERSIVVPEVMLLLILATANTILFRAAKRDVVWIVLASTLAYSAVRLGTLFLSNEMSFFMGGLALSILGNSFARKFKRPALTILLPGLIPMVPGSFGYRSLSLVFNQDVIGAMTATFTMLVIAISLVAGMTVGNVIVRPRRSI